jgi:[citrate (pro-3S)-lyase] ligase
MVLPSTEYQISAATFPTYFLKEDSIRSRLQMELDVRIFQNYFMPIFSIQTRMAGTEPLDSFTAAYNQTMKAILGPSFLEIPRLIYQDQVVSASMVRHYAKVGDYNRIKASVPQVTYDYLISKEGKALFHG